MRNRLYHPESFQGTIPLRRGYFEGYYFKCTSPSGRIIILIPGLARDAGGEARGFLQIMDTQSGETRIIDLPTDDFWFEPRRCAFGFGEQIFADSGLTLSVREDGFELIADLGFSNIIGYPKSISDPGIMGPFSFLPGLECRHAIVMMQAELNGCIEINGERVDFTGGRAYVEKDWGSSMPYSWIWASCNDFAELDRASLAFSIARVPVPTLFSGSKPSFPGFFFLVWTGSEWVREATHTGAKIHIRDQNDDTLLVTIHGKRHKIELVLQTGTSGYDLQAPVEGSMNRIIRESQLSLLSCRISGNRGEVFLTGRNASVECVNAQSLIELVQ